LVPCRTSPVRAAQMIRGGGAPMPTLAFVPLL